MGAHPLETVVVGHRRLNASGQTSHRNLAATMGAISPESRFDDLANVFFTANGLGEARKGFGAASLEPDVKAWLGEEQQRVGEARERVLSARVAEETCHALSLASAYAGLYEGAKDDRGGLDFDDLIERSRQLLTERADAAWVLYKLDGGIDHLLLDEAQDTSPDQWRHLARPGRRLLRRRRRRDDRADHLRRGRRETIDFLVPGRRARALRHRVRALSGAD